LVALIAGIPRTRIFTTTNLEKVVRKLIVAEQISLDGVIQSPGAPREDPSGEFRQGTNMPFARKRNNAPSSSRLQNPDLQHRRA